MVQMNRTGDVETCSCGEEGAHQGSVHVRVNMCRRAATGSSRDYATAPAFRLSLRRSTLSRCSPIIHGIKKSILRRDTEYIRVAAGWAEWQIKGGDLLQYPVSKVL